MNEKQRRDRALLTRLHPGLLEDVTASETPDFGGGAREPAVPIASVNPAPPPPIYRERGGWAGTEIDAAAIFPWLR